jgi:glycerol-3-phosphate dehydrogenase (NAD(P)+)
VVESINREAVNSVFLPDSPLDPAIGASNEIEETVQGAEVVVSAAPSHAVREVTAQVYAALRGTEPLVISVSKGLETGTLNTMTQVMEQTLPGLGAVALSGPSFADEVYAKRPTAVVAAGDDPDLTKLAQQVFSTSHLRVYTSRDPLGVQLAGALKNVIAIASGILDGLGLGNNARAALITRGLAEIARLGQTLRCDPMTFAGLAGMGDLILTTSGAQSRNRSLGVELAKGRSLEQILAGRRTVAEGILTTRAAVMLSERTGVELPIAQEVGNVLFHQKELTQAISDLMERELKPEQWS